jgi:hypothetical protein
MPRFEAERRKILVKYSSQLFITMEKPTVFWCFTEFRITYRVFKHKHIYKFTWQVRYTKLATDYTIGNKKMAKIVKDICFYKGDELKTDH